MTNPNEKVVCIITGIYFMRDFNGQGKHIESDEWRKIRDLHFSMQKYQPGTATVQGIR